MALSRQIRISAELHELAVQAGGSQGRKPPAQVEYWARIGLIYTSGTAVTLPKELQAPTGRELRKLGVQPKTVEPAETDDPTPLADYTKTFEALSELEDKHFVLLRDPKTSERAFHIVEDTRTHQGRIRKGELHKVQAAWEYAQKIIAEDAELERQSTYSEETDSP